MANNPFTSAPKSKNQVNVNTWDWSHVNNLTTEIGRLTPCFCQRVPAKTSFQIDATFGLKFMPMMFPIQTPIKARFSVFSMPVRALWKNYKEWISTVNMRSEEGQNINSKFVPPFISISSDTSSELYEEFEHFFGVCSDADLLGLPSTYDSVRSPEDISLSYNAFGVSLDVPAREVAESPISAFIISSITTPRNYATEKETVDGVLYIRDSFGFALGASTSTPFAPVDFVKSPFSLTFTMSGTSVSSVLSDMQTQTPETVGHLTAYLVTPVGSASEYNILSESNALSAKTTAPNTITIDFPGFDLDSFPEPCMLLFSYVNGNTSAASYNLALSSASVILQYTSTPSGDKPSYAPETCPWYDNVKKTGLKVSSLPFRMREAVYNAYVRDIRNNPLVVDGVPIYNDFVLCYDKDGDDSENYSSLGVIKGEKSQLDYFYGRKYGNWEPDRFSTCVPSPQQGQAPLVGLTNYAQVVSTSSDGVDTVKLNSVLTDEDGKSYQVHYDSDVEGLKSVRLTELNVVDSLGKPINNVYQAITEGISIEDFRQVNAYTRYLELNQRRGYSYKDITEGRYDVNIRYDDLLMPAFHGGFTRDVGVTPVTQTTPTDESGVYQGSLGSQAGDAFVKGDSDAKISFFCDEDSIVMCFIQVTPVPVYSQSLDKNTWLIESPLDVMTPEFANIGFQPVTMAEVAPIQAKNNNVTLTDVFGYQRPWSEYMSRFDVAHGLFRSQLKNFIMKRTWQGSPELSKDFLLVKPEQVNQVFSVTETTDKIFGQVAFKMFVKNIAPRSLTPRLE